MKLADLQTEARKILELTNVSDNQETNTFLVKSGGSPAVEMDMTKFILHQSNDRKYKTQMNGWAYESETIVRCTDTKTKDSKGNTIYILPNGEVFVWIYTSGDVYSFDRGRFGHPRMN
jgi:hypothetical protein